MPEISLISQKWFKNLSKERIEELDHPIMMPCISIQAERKRHWATGKCVGKIAEKSMLNEMRSRSRKSSR